MDAGKHILVGLLTEADTGAVLLSDEDGSVPLDFSNATIITGGFFPPSSVVLVEGSMTLAGVFEVGSLGHPPHEAAREHPLRGAKIAETDRGMLLVFSEVWLDKPEVLAKLEVCATSHRPYSTHWPLHDIVITNLVRCIAYKREVEGGSYIAPIVLN